MSDRPNFSLLSVVSNIERHALASDSPFLLLCLLRWPGEADPTAPQQYVRLVRDLNPCVFDADDGQGPQTYTPFNFEIGDITQSSNGSIPETELKASNVMRVLQGIINQYAGIVGGDLSLFVVNAANPAGEPDLAVEFTVKQTTSDAKLVHFKLGATSPMRRLFPLHKYRSNYCIWQYNSPPLQAAAAAAATAAGVALNVLRPTPVGQQCGYVGALTTCSHTMDGVNGCEAHGNSARFGGFPGIDTNGAVVASE